MAQAVLEMFPEAKLAIGPAIEDGFYYDFLLPRALEPKDLEDVEARMRRIIAGAFPFRRSFVDKAEALRYFQEQGQTFKVEIIEDLPEEGLEDGRVSLYQQDTFVDLCRGPHVATTGKVGAVKLLSVAGAYWRGDERRPMLQRIYGTAWETQQQLDEHLHNLEEAARRDHRRLGRELGLFSIHEESGPGLVLWHPKGGRLRTAIENFWRDEHYQEGYEIVYTPHLGRSVLWQTSGHPGFYSENMYSPMEIDDQKYYVKPMNCPFHILMYKSTVRSYRELPLRWAELGTVYRYERSGVLHGLLRVRGFTQDDAHIFCLPDQVEDEVIRAVDFAIRLLTAFGFRDYDIYLATRPDKYVGPEADWDLATESLRRALSRRALEYKVDEGGGAFYGPKVDIKIKDALGRSWQCTTVQFDFNEPERFDLSYIAEDGRQHRPFMVHRALLGSLERFLGVLIEHYAGAFPVWLAPVQAVVIPIADRHSDYAEQVVSRLRAAGFRVELDARREKMNYKIREAQVQKVPYMLVVGDKEVADGTVSVRLRTGDNLGARPVQSILDTIKRVVDEKDAALVAAS